MFGCIKHINEEQQRCESGSTFSCVKTKKKSPVLQLNEQQMTINLLVPQTNSVKILCTEWEIFSTAVQPKA